MLPAALDYLIIRNNDIHQYNTRQKHQLHGTRPTCKSVVHSFSTRSFQIWNAMSNVIDSHNFLYSFKYKTKAFLLNNKLISTMQGCQLSRIWRDSHAFDLLLTHSRN